MTNGYFFDRKDWSINSEGRGTEIHWLVALLITPIMGALFLMFLPMIGFYLTLRALTLKLAGLIRPIFYPSAMVPGEAHLLGHSPGDDLGPKTNSHALDELSKEIDSRRK